MESYHRPSKVHHQYNTVTIFNLLSALEKASPVIIVLYKFIYSFINLESQKDLVEECFGYTLQVAATEYKELRELKVTKLKGGYSFDAGLVS